MSAGFLCHHMSPVLTTGHHVARCRGWVLQEPVPHNN